MEVLPADNRQRPVPAPIRAGKDGPSPAPIVKSGTKGKWIRISASYLVAGICLFCVFHNIYWDPFFEGMAHVRWGLWIICIGLQFLAYFCVACEWQLLLRPVGRLSPSRAAQAVFAGRFANDVLPLQLGYLVRGILAARWMNVSLISIFPSLILERLWDGIWLASGIGLAALSLPLPPGVVRAANIFGAIVLAGAAATAWVVLRRRRLRPDPGIPAGRTSFQKIQFAFRRLTDGVRDIVRSGVLIPILGLSLLKLAIQAAAFLGFLRAFNLHLPFPVSLAIFLVGYLGTCVPSTPAGVGMFQLFVVAGLTFFGVGKSEAAGFALVVFVSITLPLAIAGFFALAQSGLRLQQVRGAARQSA